MRAMGLFAILALGGGCLQAAVTYQLPAEDGSAEVAIGVPSGAAGAQGYLIWMNHFVIQAGGESIKQLQISYGCTSPGCNYPNPFSTPYATTVPMYLWVGSSNNPVGATLVSQTNAVVIQSGQANTNTFITMDLLDECCFVPGTHIFVGTAVSFQGSITAGFYPAGVDSTPAHSPGNSWFQQGTTPVIPNLSTLSGPYISLIEGNFLIRATAEECPEPLSFAMAGLGLIVLVARGRRPTERGGNAGQ